MPGRDRIGSNDFFGRRMNGCRRDGLRTGRQINSYCRRNYFEDETITLKNKAQYYQEELKRINSRLDQINSQSTSNKTSE